MWNVVRVSASLCECPFKDWVMWWAPVRADEHLLVSIVENCDQSFLCKVMLYIYQYWTHFRVTDRKVNIIFPFISCVSHNYCWKVFVLLGYVYIYIRVVLFQKLSRNFTRGFFPLLFLSFFSLFLTVVILKTCCNLMFNLTRTKCLFVLLSALLLFCLSFFALLST